MPALQPLAMARVSVTIRSPLVMSIAVGYPTEVFDVFLGTLRDGGYRGGIALVVGESLSDEVTELCRRHSATLYPRLQVGLQDDAHGAGLQHPQFLRFSVYPKLCLHHFDACFATDFRDVVFQADPFLGLRTPLQSDWLVVALEQSRTVAEDSVNSLWVNACYGRHSQELKSMRGKTVVCSGTIFGSPAGFEVLAAAYKRTACRSARDGIDQGVLNTLIYAPSQRHLLKAMHITLQPLSAGQVVTLGGFKGPRLAHLPYAITFNATEGILRRPDTGAAYPVVHQYDRFVDHPWGPPLRIAVLQRFQRIPCVAAGKALQAPPWSKRTPRPPSFGTPSYAGGLIKAMCSAKELSKARERALK